MRKVMHQGMKLISFFLLALALLGGAPVEFTTSAALQSSPVWIWQKITLSEGPLPDARAYGTAIHDPIGNRVIVFGGMGARGFLNDLWAFDLATATWKQLTPVGAPPSPRRGHNAIYDPVGHQMIVWAGQGAGFFDDTWTLNLTTLEWRNVSPSTRPRARYGSVSVYDPVERRLVQFAGFTSEARRFQDTQAFSLQTQTWQDLTPPGDKPQIRCLHTGAYDAASRRMIIYGGQRSGPLDDLWAFDLNLRAWTQLTPAQRPAGRFFATSFVDSDDGRFIVFGGSTTGGDVNETWAFNFETGQWNQIQIQEPPSRRNGMMGAYIEDENRFIIFGGNSGGSFLNDLWELRKM